MNATILSIVLGIGGMFGWGIYDFLGGVFAKQVGSFKSLFWSQLAGLLSILTLAFILKTSMNVPIFVLVLFPIAAIFYSAGYLFFSKALKSATSLSLPPP